MIYEPSEDSYLLQNTITKYLKNKSKTLKILDMGSGSGIQALSCKKLLYKNITTTDINPNAIKNLKLKNLNPVLSNLFSKINPTKKFDLIIFNPPYLPKDNREPEPTTNTTAGKQGNEIIIKFLKQGTKHLNKDGSILLLFSSLSKPKTILKEAIKLNYKYNLLNTKKLFFEELFVYEFKLIKYPLTSSSSSRAKYSSVPYPT